jgi:hypothetical protein
MLRVRELPHHETSQRDPPAARHAAQQARGSQAAVRRVRRVQQGERRRDAAEETKRCQNLPRLTFTWGILTADWLCGAELAPTIQ